MFVCSVFNFKFNSREKQNIQIKILNTVGEKLISYNLQQFIGEYTKEFDLANHAKGIYLFEIETDEGVISKKLILQ